MEQHYQNLKCIFTYFLILEAVREEFLYHVFYFQV